MNWLKFIYEGLTAKFNNRAFTYLELNNVFRCKECSNLKYNKIINFFFKEVCKRGSPIQGMYCNNCKCILSLKIRSKSKCPIGLWMIKK